METKGNYLKTRKKIQSETYDIMYHVLFLSPRIPHTKGMEKTITQKWENRGTVKVKWTSDK